MWSPGHKGFPGGRGPILRSVEGVEGTRGGRRELVPGTVLLKQQPLCNKVLALDEVVKAGALEKRADC